MKSPGRSPHSRRLAWVLVAYLGTLLSLAHAQDAPRPDNALDVIRDGGTDRENVAPEVSPPAQPNIDAILIATQRVRDFLAGSLDVSLDLTTLFDIDIADDQAVQVEAKRLRGVIACAEHSPAPPPSPAAAKGRRMPRTVPQAPRPPDVGDVEVSPESKPVTPDPALFAARLDLDRARLEFYSFPTVRRNALARRHSEQQEADREEHASQGLTDAEQRVQDAEVAHRQAVEAARHAQSEAQRLREEERARLLGIVRALANLEEGLTHSRAALENRAEETLAFRRRVRDALARQSSDGAGTDRLYDELRTFLRASRSELDAAISGLFTPSRAPGPGDVRLGDFLDGDDRSVWGRSGIVEWNGFYRTPPE